MPTAPPPKPQKSTNTAMIPISTFDELPPPCIGADGVGGWPYAGVGPEATGPLAKGVCCTAMGGVVGAPWAAMGCSLLGYTGIVDGAATFGCGAGVGVAGCGAGGALRAGMALTVASGNAGTDTFGLEIET